MPPLIKDLLLRAKLFFNTDLRQQQKRLILFILSTKREQCRYGKEREGGAIDILRLIELAAVEDELSFKDQGSSYGFLPTPITNYYHFHTSTCYIEDSKPYCTLSILNDRGMSFNGLAHFIYENRRKVFKNND